MTYSSKFANFCLVGPKCVDGVKVLNALGTLYLWQFFIFYSDHVQYGEIRKLVVALSPK